jgi:hypothetical protein
LFNLNLSFYWICFYLQYSVYYYLMLCHLDVIQLFFIQE